MVGSRGCITPVTVNTSGALNWGCSIFGQPHWHNHPETRETNRTHVFANGVFTGLKSAKLIVFMGSRWFTYYFHPSFSIIFPWFPVSNPFRPAVGHDALFFPEAPLANGGSAARNIAMLRLFRATKSFRSMRMVRRVHGFLLVLSGGSFCLGQLGLSLS